jgi:Leucine-rich repeat (LRR) protein
MNFFLSNIDLHDDAFSKVSVKFQVEGLSSLKILHFETKRTEVDFSIKNMPSLTNLYLTISGTIDEDIVTQFVDECPHIQQLYLKGNLSYFNLDSLVNLRKLSLIGTIDDSFNFELFENLSKQLEDIKLEFTNMDEKSFVKLFDGCNFPYLVDFSLRFIDITTLKKEFLDRFPMLIGLAIIDCKIEEIESDSFSNLLQLCTLDLSQNRIQSIEENAFSKLKNLKKVKLNDNKLKKFDPKFVGLSESAEFSVRGNYIRFGRQERSKFMF